MSEFEQLAQAIRDQFEVEIAERGITEDTDPEALAFGRRLVEQTIAELRQLKTETLH